MPFLDIIPESGQDGYVKNSNEICGATEEPIGYVDYHSGDRGIEHPVLWGTLKLENEEIYTYRRPYAYFDTSALPVGATITDIQLVINRRFGGSWGADSFRDLYIRPLTQLKSYYASAEDLYNSLSAEDPVVNGCTHGNFRMKKNYISLMGGIASVTIVSSTTYRDVNDEIEIQLKGAIYRVDTTDGNGYITSGTLLFPGNGYDGRETSFGSGDEVIEVTLHTEAVTAVQNGWVGVSILQPESNPAEEESFAFASSANVAQVAGNIGVADPTNGSITPTDSGTIPDTGELLTFKIYAKTNIDDLFGAYSEGYLELQYQEEEIYTQDGYYLNLSWDVVDGAVGYKVVVTDPHNSFADDYYFFALANSCTYGNQEESMIAQSPIVVTPKGTEGVKPYLRIVYDAKETFTNPDNNDGYVKYALTGADCGDGYNDWPLLPWLWCSIYDAGFTEYAPENPPTNGAYSYQPYGNYNQSNGLTLIFNVYAMSEHGACNGTPTTITFVEDGVTNENYFLNLTWNAPTPAPWGYKIVIVQDEYAGYANDHYLTSEVPYFENYGNGAEASATQQDPIILPETVVDVRQRRSYSWFDTSTIPTDATITKIELYINLPDIFYHNTARDTLITRMEQEKGDFASAEDIYNAIKTNDVYAQGLYINVDNTIDLGATAITDWASHKDWMGVGIMLDDTSPPTVEEAAQYSSEEAGLGSSYWSRRPYLLFTYESGGVVRRRVCVVKI